MTLIFQCLRLDGQKLRFLETMTQTHIVKRKLWVCVTILEYFSLYSVWKTEMDIDNILVQKREEKKAAENVLLTSHPVWFCEEQTHFPASLMVFSVS